VHGMNSHTYPLLEFAGHTLISKARAVTALVILNIEKQGYFCDGTQFRKFSLEGRNPEWYSGTFYSWDRCH
jgi:hypothetical protein